jgi:tetratricopeptide (TPR) repeat protein
MKRYLTGVTAMLIAAFVFVAAGCGSKDKEQAKADGADQNVAKRQQAVGQPVDHSEALKSYEAMLKKDPNDWNALTGMADAYFGVQRFSDAIIYYQKAIEVKPDDIDSYNDLGLAYHYTGNSGKGLEYVNKGIEKNPYLQRIWLTKGFILAYGTGDLDGAKAAWEKAKSMDPNSQVAKAADDFLAQFADKGKK